MATSKATEVTTQVLVVGAGPVGLLVALRLAQAGIKTALLEKGSTLDDSPRAVGYFAASLIAFHKAKILNKIEDVGFTSAGIVWRNPITDDGKGGKKLGEPIAHLPLPTDPQSGHGFTNGTLYLRQSELSKLVSKEAVAAGVSLEFGEELTGFVQDDHKVCATSVNAEKGTTTNWTADFMVGTDGGRSTVRKILGIEMTGHSWPQRIVSIDYMDDQDLMDKEYPTSLIVNEVNFGLVSPLESPRLGTKTIHRCTVALDSQDNRPNEEVTSKESLAKLLDIMVPGVRPLRAEAMRGAVYRTHQLCAQGFRRGRVVLAGDAAHLNTPFGAMGLTTGIIDSEAIADVLELIILGGAPIDALSVYSNERMRAFQLFVDPVTSANQCRMARNSESAMDDWLMYNLAHPTKEFLEDYGKPMFTTWRKDMTEAVTKRFPDYVPSHKVASS
ncbi:FAD-binding monooxygenase [Leptodontidium sp. MPI-SDFR-AT-0119]|nr:FAD-binding monooxygenase [Leptodontidium sp. MPI-SDFR-AT-0119]